MTSKTNAQGVCRSAFT